MIINSAYKELKEILEKQGFVLSDEEVVRIGEKVLNLYKKVALNKNNSGDNVKEEL